MAEWTRRRILVRVGVPAGLVAAGVVIASAAHAGTSSSAAAARYVLATVGHGDIVRTLELTGTVTGVDQTVAALTVGGTVSSVAVSPGERVRAGQVLATIDPTALVAAVTAARASVTQAQAAVAGDLATGSGQSTAQPETPAPSPSASTFQTVTGPGAGAAARDSSVLRRQITQAQAAIAADARAVMDAIVAAASSCGTSATSGSPGATTAPDPVSPTPSQAPAPSTAGTPAGAGRPAADLGAGGARNPDASSPRPSRAPTDCPAALAAARAAQLSGDADQRQLFVLVAQLERGISGSAAPAAALASARAPSAVPTSGVMTQRQGAASASTAAGRLLVDQAAVVSAQTALDDADANLLGATLRAPLSGTVAGVGLAVGASAAPGDGVTIVGPGPVAVTVNVPLASVGKVRPGQRALIRANGATVPALGRVETIGLLPTSGATTISYPATILTSASARLFSGSRAQVTLELGTVSGATLVANSALTRLSAQSAAVTVLNSSGTLRRIVSLGAVGTLTSQVTSGLAVGERVVLADRSLAVPANSAAATRRLTGGGQGVGFARGGG